MFQLPDAYADTPRVQAVATALGITFEAANQGFAQYVPRDAIEADMVEQILQTRARLNAATRRVLQPDLPPIIAARIDRTINTMTRELRALLDRLELRQNRFTGHLPQQYWRVEPVRQVGPVPEDAVPQDVTAPHVMAPDVMAPDVMAQDTVPQGAMRKAAMPAQAAPAPDDVQADDQPCHPVMAPSPHLDASHPENAPPASGDALARFTAMRIPPGLTAQEAWAIASRNAALGEAQAEIQEQATAPDQEQPNRKQRRAQEKLLRAA